MTPESKTTETVADSAEHQMVEQSPTEHSGAGVRPASQSLDSAQARVFRNVWFNFVGYAVTMLVALFISPLLVHKLGDVAYGVLALVQQLIGYTVLLDFGIRIAVTRYLAQHHAKDEIDTINHTMSTACVVAAIPATIIVLGGTFAAYFFPKVFSVPPQLVFTSRMAVVFMAIAAATAGPGSLFTACITAVSRYDLLSIRNIACVVFRGLLLWILLSLGKGLLTVAIVTLLVAVLGLSMEIWFAYSQLPTLRIGLQFFQWGTLHTLMRFSSYAFLTTIAVRLVYWSDNIVVGAILGTAAVTYYSIGGALIQYLRDAMSTVTMVFSPIASQMDALARRDSLQRLLVSGSKIGSLVAVPGVIVFVLAGPAFLSLWMGPDYGTKSGPILILLSGTILVLPLASIYSHVLYAMNRHAVGGVVAMAEAAANVGLSVWFARRMGIEGVALGTLIPAVLFQGVVMPLYTARVVGIRTVTFYTKGLLGPFLAAPPAVAVLCVARFYGWLQSWTHWCLCVLLSVLLYFVFVWLFVLFREEKDFLVKSIRSSGLLPESWLRR